MNVLVLMNVLVRWTCSEGFDSQQMSGNAHHTFQIIIIFFYIGLLSFSQVSVDVASQ